MTALTGAVRSRPARLRMSRTVLGGTRMPAPVSSPLIRW